MTKIIENIASEKTPRKIEYTLFFRIKISINFFMQYYAAEGGTCHILKFLEKVE